MKQIFAIFLFVLHTALCSEEEKKQTEALILPSNFNASCLQVECPAADEPICVKIKYERPELRNKTVYIVMVNSCEMGYFHCYKDIKAEEMSMENCDHTAAQPPDKKRPKRFAKMKTKGKSKASPESHSSESDSTGDARAKDVLELIANADEKHRTKKGQKPMPEDIHPLSDSEAKNSDEKQSSEEKDDNRKVRVTRMGRAMVRRKRGLDITETTRSSPKFSPEQKRKRRMMTNIKKLKANLRRMWNRPKRQAYPTDGTTAGKINNEEHPRKKLFVKEYKEGLKKRYWNKPMSGELMFGGNRKLKVSEYKETNENKPGIIRLDQSFQKPMLSVSAFNEHTDNKLSDGAGESQATPTNTKNEDPVNSGETQYHQKQNEDRLDRNKKELEKSDVKHLVDNEPMFKHAVFGDNSNKKLNLKVNDINAQDDLKKPMFAKPVFGGESNAKLEDKDNNKQYDIKKPTFAKQDNPKQETIEANENDQSSDTAEGEPDNNRPDNEPGKQEDSAGDNDDKQLSYKVDREQYSAECPSVCPARDVMVCGRCRDNIYRTFLSVCHLRMFNCKFPEEKIELISRSPCVLSAPYHHHGARPQGTLAEPGDDDLVLRYVWCQEKQERSMGRKKLYDPRCKNFYNASESQPKLSLKEQDDSDY